MARFVHTFAQVMKWSWKLGRFAGIDTYVHATFLLIVAWAAWASYAGAGTAVAAFLGVAFLLAVFGSVLLHELGHALVARRYGIRTRKIILSPIGGLAQLEGMPAHPKQELAVALAGPAVNFALAAVLLGVGTVTAWPMLGLLEGLMWANLSLGLFNLIPAFPMDGGRALRAFLATRMGNHTATEIAARIGKVAAVGMGVVGLFTTWVLVPIAVFVWFAANSELRLARQEREWELYDAGGWRDPSPVVPRAGSDWVASWLRAPAQVRDGWSLRRGEPRVTPRYRIIVLTPPPSR